MSFLTHKDYLTQISQEDFDTLTEENPVLGELPTESEEDEPEEDPDPAPEPEPTILALAQRTAEDEVASYLRGRFDMEAAYSKTGKNRNAQLVMYLVDVTLWHLMPRVAFRQVTEIRQTRYNAALKWLTMAQDGKSNPNLPRYPSGSGSTPQAHRLFRSGSQAVRSHSFN